MGMSVQSMLARLDIEYRIGGKPRNACRDMCDGRFNQTFSLFDNCQLDPSLLTNKVDESKNT